MSIFHSCVTLFRKFFRTIFTSTKSFFDDDCYTKASALSFYTLQSIIPFLAFALAFAKGFGFENYLEEQITKIFLGQEEVLNYSLQFAHSMLDQITTGGFVGFGVLLLIWSSINLLGYVEIVLNSIWRVKTPRTTYQKIRDFLLILIIAPLILVSLSGIPLYLQNQLTIINSYRLLNEFSSYFMYFILTISPIALNCLFFFIIYAFIPNTKVRISPRISASLITGIIFYFWQLIYLDFLVTLFNYNAVYGAFAILPLFLIWLQISWLIVLFGAEFSATIENGVFLNKITAVRQIINQKELTLLILLHCLKAFYNGSKALTSFKISRELKVPLRTIEELLEVLVKKNLLTVVKNGELSYLPSIDPDKVTIKDVLEAIDDKRNAEIPVESSEHLTRISNLLNELDNTERNAKSNITLKKLIAKGS